MSDLDADGAHIAELARRIAEARCERIRSASRGVSQVEAIIRPLRDRRLLDLIFLLQTALSERLSDVQNCDGSVGG